MNLNSEVTRVCILSENFTKICSMVHNIFLVTDKDRGKITVCFSAMVINIVTQFHLLWGVVIILMSIILYKYLTVK